MKMRFPKPIFLLVLLSFTLACAKTTLLQDIDQKNANDVMVLLAKHGIGVGREAIEKQQETTWTIYVSAGDEEQARELLVANHLPRQRELGLSGVCKEAGLIPTPKTEKCRELLAMKGEIINSLESLPGVVNADVVLNVPDKEDFPDEDSPAKRPTASVVIEVRDTKGQEEIAESKIQQFVANAVTGMDLRDVSVIISRAESPFISISTPETAEDSSGTDGGESSVESIPSEGMTSVGGFQMDYRSARKFKILAILFLVFFIILSIALIVVLLKLASMRQKRGVPATQNPALPERAAMDKLVEEAGRTEEKRPMGKL